MGFIIAYVLFVVICGALLANRTSKKKKDKDVVDEMKRYVMEEDKIVFTIHTRNKVG